MKNTNKSRKINWRQLVVHFIGSWLFIYAFQCFGYLMDADTSSVLMQSEPGNRLALMSKKNVGIENINDLLSIVSIVRLVGLVIAFGVSLLVSVKEKWYWVNSLIVFFIVGVLSWFNLLGWSQLKNVFLTPGQLFKSNADLYFGVNAAVLFLLGCLAFFWNKSIRFIDKGI